MISWVARTKCGHDVGGKCAEAHLPVSGTPVWCGPCEEGSYLVDVIDSRPQRLETP